MQRSLSNTCIYNDERNFYGFICNDCCLYGDACLETLHVRFIKKETVMYDYIYFVLISTFFVVNKYLYKIVFSQSVLL